ncbi:MAG: class I SAM-dependent methyltransferase, partial [Dongiaceae bacterium]
GFTYCELGCGVGVTALILAASNPRGRFVAVDFHPVHILKARSVAHAAGLTNIEFLEHSFEQLADGGSAALPPLDFITLHGVYSWVSHETRRQIVSIMARHLKPGGLAYVSYNAMPGSAQRQPVQRLLWDLAALTPSRSDQRIARAIEQLDALKTAGARALAGNEFASDAMKQLKHGAEQYLAHEYLNEHWNPMYHADLARELAAAKLTYAGSANLIENFAEVMLDAEQREFLNSLGAPHLRETLRDFCTNKTFRKDVFVRGAHQLSASRQFAQLSQIKLALLVPREEFKFEIEAPAGKGDLNRAVYGAVVDALAEGPRTVAELVSLPTMPGSHQMSPLELVGILVGTRQAAPVVDGVAPVDQAAA